MTRSLPTFLCEIAGRLLPMSRRPWADAMIAELSHTDDGRAALSFAGGCLLAALSERVRDADTHFVAVLWSIAVITALDSIFRLACAARGLNVLFGAPDGMRQALLQHGASAAITAGYDNARPTIVVCFMALGLAQLATAWFLSRGQLRHFFVAWSIALLIAGVAVTIQLSIIWTVEGVPSELRALLLQAVAVPGLLVWSRTRRWHLQE